MFGNSSFLTSLCVSFLRKKALEMLNNVFHNHCTGMATLIKHRPPTYEKITFLTSNTPELFYFLIITKYLQVSFLIEIRVSVKETHKTSIIYLLIIVTYKCLNEYCVVIYFSQCEMLLSCRATCNIRSCWQHVSMKHQDMFLAILRGQNAP